MISRSDISTKRIAIDKANAQMLIAVGVASFVVVFSLVAGHAVWTQVSYQQRVTTAKSKAHQQLQKNLQAFDDLSLSYKVFDNASTNVIGGTKDGTGDKDGTNSIIVLDSLPSAYDFPALASSLEKILGDQGLKDVSISGTDDQLNQQKNGVSPTPKPVPMPFTISVNQVTYDGVQKLIDALQRSVRPIQVDQVSLNGGTGQMSLTMSAHTYYQPGKSVNISKQVVK